MPAPTKTQLKYLSFIRAYTEGFGQPPSMQEIAEALKVSSPSVNGMLKTLEKNGLIEREAGAARSIEILVDRALIPAWKKKLKSNIQFWAPADASQAQLDQIMESIVSHRKAERISAKREKEVAAKIKAGESPTVYQFKISLNNFKPSIWRRIETLDVTLAELHELIQTAMGWTNSHLHMFRVADQEYADNRMVDEDLGAIDYSGVRVSDLVRQHGPKLKILYEYDFGDGWEHTIVLEKTTPLTGSAGDYPRCLKGVHACPPEDVGGVWGFSDYLDAITDPSHPSHDEMLEWSGPYDFDRFDVQETTAMMQSGLPYGM
ncbi:MAG: MarR family transcriptional regulator [Planctomycetales bacterium]|nr:MarR family transcriptional regulator [Planctomycetales bacterium]